jgi:hypothetical protein
MDAMQLHRPYCYSIEFIDDSNALQHHEFLELDSLPDDHYTAHAYLLESDNEILSPEFEDWILVQWRKGKQIAKPTYLAKSKTSIRVQLTHQVKISKYAFIIID